MWNTAPKRLITRRRWLHALVPYGLGDRADRGRSLRVLYLYAVRRPSGLRLGRDLVRPGRLQHTHAGLRLQRDPVLPIPQRERHLDVSEPRASAPRQVHPGLVHSGAGLQPLRLAAARLDSRRSRRGPRVSGGIRALEGQGRGRRGPRGSYIRRRVDLRPQLLGSARHSYAGRLRGLLRPALPVPVGVGAEARLVRGVGPSLRRQGDHVPPPPTLSVLHRRSRGEAPQEADLRRVHTGRRLPRPVRPAHGPPRRPRRLAEGQLYPHGELGRDVGPHSGQRRKPDIHPLGLVPQHKPVLPGQRPIRKGQRRRHDSVGGADARGVSVEGQKAGNGRAVPLVDLGGACRGLRHGQHDAVQLLRGRLQPHGGRIRGVRDGRGPGRLGRAQPEGPPKGRSGQGCDEKSG